jgi:NodT family efflux transporter outer membrane factor (OMF) lipoprotein
MNGVGNFDTNLSPNIGQDSKIPNPTPDLYLGFRTSWEIGLWGRFRNMKKAAVARFLASEKGRHLIITDLVAEVSRLYYELLALDNELLTTKNNIELQEDAVEIINVMKEAGRSNELAVKQFEAQLLDTRSIQIELQQEIIGIENKLNLLLARFPQPIKRGRPIREQIFPERIQAGVPSSLLTQRPDIVQAELELQAAKADIKVARAAFFPSLNIGAYAGFNAFKPELLLRSPESVALGALAGISAPLWNQAIIKSNFRRINSQQLEAYNNYQRSIVNGVQEVVTTMNGIENYNKIYNLKKQETESLYQAVAASKDLFVAGKASYLEVITAQKSVLQSELEWSETRKKQFISLIDLYRALGGGWE